MRKALEPQANGIAHASVPHQAAHEPRLPGRDGARSVPPAPTHPCAMRYRLSVARRLVVHHLMWGVMAWTVSACASPARTGELRESPPQPESASRSPERSPSRDSLATSPVDATPPLVLTVAEHGMAARYYEPRPGSEQSRAAVVIVGGSDGGFPAERLARALADAGHPTLALAYFSGRGAGITGLPARLQRIPLESGQRALDWQAARTRRPLALIGESRGAELVLLLAARRPDLAGVVAFAPSSAVWQAPTMTLDERAAPAWTERGQPLAYLQDDRTPDLAIAERFMRSLARGLGDAAIPVAAIRARVLLIAGEDDRIWPSAAMADALAADARRAGRPDVTVLRYPNAGHLLMGPGPGRSRLVVPGYVVEFGGTDEGNRAARDDAWAKTLAFLSSLRSAP